MMIRQAGVYTKAESSVGGTVQGFCYFNATYLHFKNRIKSSVSKAPAVPQFKIEFQKLHFKSCASLQLTSYIPSLPGARTKAETVSKSPVI